MKIIKGKDCGVNLGTKRPYHATNHSFSWSTEKETWETKDSNGPQDLIKRISGTATVEGLMCVAETEDQNAEAIDTPTLFDMFLAKEPVELTLLVMGGKYTGQAIITDFSEGAPVEGHATYNATFSFYELEKQTA